MKQRLFWSLERQILLTFAFALILLIGLGVASYLSVAGLLEKAERVTHTQEVLSNLEATLSALKDAETAQRGFLLTGRKTFLKPYDDSRPLITIGVTRLNQLTLDNPVQQERLREMDQLVATRLNLLDRGINLRQQMGESYHAPVETLEQGQVLMDGLRMKVNEMKAMETSLLSEREQSANSAAQRTLMLIPLVSVLTIIVTSLALATILRELKQRQRAEQQLHTLNTELSRSNRELQDFAFVASHDLQEPLRKIQAFGDRLKSKYADALSTEGQDYLERMQNAARRMHTLINDLLVYSRVTTKGQPFASVDLDLIAREVLNDLEVRIQQSDAQVEIVSLPKIEADALQMRQLLQNLIGNALKFQRKGEPPLVKVTAESLADGNCQIAVADNGIGFEEKYLDRIFTPFQRLHGRNEYEGTGMGLAVCRRIVERHGGQITAQSVPNQGTTFLVTLPIRQQGEQNR